MGVIKGLLIAVGAIISLCGFLCFAGAVAGTVAPAGPPTAAELHQRALDGLDDTPAPADSGLGQQTLHQCLGHAGANQYNARVRDEARDVIAAQPDADMTTVAHVVADRETQQDDGRATTAKAVCLLGDVADVWTEHHKANP